MTMYDPSTSVQGEEETTMRQTEHQVSIAYDEGMAELDLLLELANRFEEPPPSAKNDSDAADELAALRRYRTANVKDVARM
jgi:hypothetical protein